MTADAGENLDLQRAPPRGQINFIDEGGGISVDPGMFECRGQGSGSALVALLREKRCVSDLAVAGKTSGALQQLLALGCASATRE